MNRLLLAALAACLFAPAAVAQDLPLAPRDLDRLFSDPPRVEINLRGSLLRLASEAMREDDPALSEMVRGLRGITIRIYPMAEMSSSLLRSLDDISQGFEDSGWSTLVRVRASEEEDDQDVWIYVRDEGDLFGGLAIMAVDRDDETASFVFFDGTIDPAQVGRLGSKFGGVDVDLDIDIDE
jgi:opacity protein-like surface antigen